MPGPSPPRAAVRQARGKIPVTGVIKQPMFKTSKKTWRNNGRFAEKVSKIAGSPVKVEFREKGWYAFTDSELAMYRIVDKYAGFGASNVLHGYSNHKKCYYVGLRYTLACTADNFEVLVVLPKSSVYQEPVRIVQAEKLVLVQVLIDETGMWYTQAQYLTKEEAVEAVFDGGFKAVEVNPESRRGF